MPMVNIDDVFVRRLVHICVYMYIYTVNITDKRKVCNRSYCIVFSKKLLTDTIKYTLQTVENYKWNSK